MRNTVRAGLLAVAATLAACGGGGDSSGSGFAAGSGGGSAGGAGGTALGAAQGFYNGSSSSGEAFAMVVLENGAFWTLLLRNGVVYSGLHGQSTSTGSNLSGSGFDYDLPSNARSPGTLSASFGAKANIAGSLSAGHTTTFNASYDASYERPATLANLIGTWNGEVVAPAGLHGASITVNADGSLQGFVNTCTYTGTTTPRASGTAVFDTRITFAASGCLFSGQTVTGLSMLRASAGSHALVTAALLPDGSAAFAFAASR